MKKKLLVYLLTSVAMVGMFASSDAMAQVAKEKTWWRKKLIEALKKQMSEYADRLEYEQAAAVRDQIQEIERTYGKK